MTRFAGRRAAATLAGHDGNTIVAAAKDSDLVNVLRSSFISASQRFKRRELYQRGLYVLVKLLRVLVRVNVPSCWADTLIK
jgi:hypothetical protein